MEKQVPYDTTYHVYATYVYLHTVTIRGYFKFRVFRGDAEAWWHDVGIV
jgi:hypothetical protein